MRRRLLRLVFRLYARLPRPARRRVVRAIAPTFTVGAMCFIERDDGALLLVEHSYRTHWGVPGGLLDRDEEPHVTVHREVAEEVGVTVEILGAPAVHVDPDPRRVDLIYRARYVSGQPRPISAEIDSVAWFAPGELPDLQFETMRALVTLARVAADPPMPGLGSLPALVDRHGDDR